MLITKSECIRILGEAKNIINTTSSLEEATKAYKKACNCKSALKPFHCGKMSCENCYLTKDYYIALRRIAYTEEMNK